MTPLLALWLPILLAAVLVFVASSLLHMVVPIHKGDYRKMPDEAETLAALRQANLPPGQYMFPCPSSMKDMASPEMLAKFAQGPVGTLVLRPNGAPTMGKALVQWFVFCVLVSLLVAYVSGLALPRGAGAMPVLRITSACAFLGYAFASVTDSIWKGIDWTTTAKFVFDGLVYALVTGAAFAWLWPAA